MQEKIRLYKLKSLHGDGLLHVVDSIVNERIYLSTREFMNDINEAHWKCVGDCIHNIPYRDVAQQFRKFADSIRFTCFVETINNHLMWAHYAGGFGGVAMEYELDPKLHQIQKIEYIGIPDVAKEAMEKVLNGEIHITETGVLKRKDPFWVDEGEWRAFGISSSRYILETKPKALIFGPKLSESSVHHAVLKKLSDMSRVRLGYLVPGMGVELNVEYEEEKF